MTESPAELHPAERNSALTVCRLTAEYRPAWDNYVLESPYSTIYHLLGLKDSIEDTYQAKTVYLIAINNSKNVVGVLPMAIVRLPWLTDALVSLPYSNYGGPLADSDIVAVALLREAESIRASLGLGCLMVKGLSHANFEAFTVEKIHYSMVLDTNRSFEDVWSKSFAKSCRNHCNRAARLGVHVELGNDDRLLHDFYALYVRPAAPVWYSHAQYCLVSAAPETFGKSRSFCCCVSRAYSHRRRLCTYLPQPNDLQQLGKRSGIFFDWR